jgi:demethylspheroidene O-methyltransferase
MGHRLEALPMPHQRQTRLATLRDRLLTNPRFLKWASAFPLTRLIARRRADALFDLCAGFVYSQILYACVKLGLFNLLREGPQELAPLARWLGLPEPRAARLLGAAAALRLVERRGRTLYGLGPLGAAVAGNPGIAAMVEHHTHLYADLADPIRLLRGERSDTALGIYWPYADSGDPAALSAEAVAAYSRLMAQSQPLVAEEVLDAYPLNRHRCLLDIGGGEGAFLVAAAAEAPALRLMLFDLPAVVDRARERLARAGLGDRFLVSGGDFLKDQLPAGADVVTLIRVLLDHDDTNALKILQAARRAIAPGGTLLIAESMAELPGTESMAGAYFGFYLMAMGRGRAGSPKQLSRLVEQAGFDRISLRTGRRVLRTGILTAQISHHC